MKSKGFNLRIFLFFVLFLCFSCTFPVNSEKVVEEDKKSKELKGSFKLCYSPDRASVEDIADVVISIEDNNGNVIFDSHVLTMYNMNGNFISAGIQLNAGNYKLTKFLLIDNENNILFAAPVEGSPQSAFVDNPLPVEFTISSDQTTTVTPEVVAVEGLTPEDFGYVTFSFEVVTDDIIPNNAVWTVMVHFAVDNDLEYGWEETLGIIGTQLEVLEELKRNDVNNNLNILVLLDASINTADGYVSPYKDGYYWLRGGSIHDDLIVDTGEINSGDVNQEKNFLQWAVTNYPANKYYFSIHNHGGGFDDPSITGVYMSSRLSGDNRGIGYDESHGYDRLTHYELGEATAYFKSIAGKSIDVMYFDACLMGGIELAYQLKDNVDYMVFSEELYPIALWKYDGLSVLNENPGISARDLGIHICDSAYNYFMTGNIPEPLVNSAILALVDSSKVQALYNELDDYALAAINDINTNNNAFVYNDAAYDTDTMWFNNDHGFYYKDIGNYLDQIMLRSGISQEVKNRASDVENALSQCVIHKIITYQRPICGLYIFHNIWNSGREYPISLYRSILSFSSNGWTDYLDKMKECEEEIVNYTVDPDQYEPDDYPNETVITADDPYQIHTFHDINDWDYFKIDLSNVAIGTTVTIETRKNTDYYPGVHLRYYLSHGMTSVEINDEYDDFPDYSWVHEEPGIYYLQINSNTVGDYIIEVKIE